MNDTKEEQKLTERQELYVEYLCQGYSQRKAYIMAFPDSKDSTANCLDMKASLLLKKPNVHARYEELCQIITEENIRKAIWTKEQAIAELKKLMEKNIRESDHYEDAYLEEMDMYNRQIQEKQEQINNPKTYLSKKNRAQLQQEIDDLIMAKIRCNRRQQSNKSVNEAILSSIAQLNSLLGFDKKEDVKLDTNVTFINDIPMEDTNE